MPPARFVIEQWMGYATLGCRLLDRETGQTVENWARVSLPADQGLAGAEAVARRLLRLWAEERARIEAHPIEPGEDPAQRLGDMGFECRRGPDCAICRDLRVEEVPAP